MASYYDDKLSAEHLKQAYDVATPRVRQYLDAEIEYVLGFVRRENTVLELGCGYGRVLLPLSAKSKRVAGIDTSRASLEFAREALAGASNVWLAAADAVKLPFKDTVFDVVACIQNGISAFHVDRRALIKEALRVTKRGGMALFSSYSGEFWEDRLEWFELQAGAGLLGEIDYEKTGGGVIVCKDGFAATTVRADEFLAYAAGLDVDVNITEVDGSSVFCEITPR